MTAKISDDVRQARHWLTAMAKDLRGEVPMRIHESKPGGLGFAPPFHPDFIAYIGNLNCKDPSCNECRGREHRPKHYFDGDGTRKPEVRMRAKRAFRKLREVSPIEFDVLWLAVMHGLTVQQISVRLSEWEERRGSEQRYTEADIVVLALAGIDKASKWF
jgi:hypothetical protein